MSEPPKIGDKTKWGRIVAVACFGGERYYFTKRTTFTLTDVAMLPALVLEPERKP